MDNPHDKRYKELFSNKKSFISFLKDCVKETWVDEIDEDSLTKTNSSFILPDFSAKEADIVYEAKINGSTVVFYVLLELQSTVDYRMPYRLLLYIVEILRKYYNYADANERDNKDFKFPVVFPIVFFNGKDKWTVPLNLREMFANAEIFGGYALNFEYMLVNAKGFDNADLKNFKSKLLGLILTLEKTRNDLEFYGEIRENLKDIDDFDEEEKRILSLCLKLMDIAYGYNNSEAIKELLDESNIMEADKMLSEIIENARLEKEQLVSQGISQGLSQGEFRKALSVAKVLLSEKIPLSLIMKATNLSEEQIEGLEAFQA